MYSEHDYYEGHCLSLILSAIVVIGLIIFVVVCASNKDSVTATVTDKQVRGESGTYYVYTDEEVFVMKDSPFYFRWGSSDDWSMLEIGETYEFYVIGETYEFDVTGYRIPILSRLKSGCYRNIIDYELIDTGDDSL